VPEAHNSVTTFKSCGVGQRESGWRRYPCGSKPARHIGRRAARGRHVARGRSIRLFVPLELIQYPAVSNVALEAPAVTGLGLKTGFYRSRQAEGVGGSVPEWEEIYFRIT